MAEAAAGATEAASYVTRAHARTTIRDLDHISSLRLRENQPTGYYSCGSDSGEPRSQVPVQILTIDGISRGR